MRVTRKPSEIASGIPWLDSMAGIIVGRLTLWLGVRAAKRRDWHEANHCLMALFAGNSQHDNTAACQLPADMARRLMQNGEQVTLIVRTTR